MKLSEKIAVATATSLIAVAVFYNPNPQDKALELPATHPQKATQSPSNYTEVAISKKGFPRHITAGEKECLIETLYHEARGEPKQGQIAVVYVVLNRALSETRKYGKTSDMCDITRAPKAFSWYDGTKKIIADKDAWVSAMGVVDTVIQTYSLKNSPVADATHYVNTKMATTRTQWWKSNKMTILADVGAHTFFKQKNEVIAMNRV